MSNVEMQLAGVILYLSLMVFLISESSVLVNGCEVRVASPWERKTFIPSRGALTSVSVNCTAGSEVYWSMKFPDRDGDAIFQVNKVLLNSRGFFQEPPVNVNTKATIRLFINSTQDINGTWIRCVNLTAKYVEETTLIESTQFKIKSNDVGILATNISWSLPESERIAEAYTLVINSDTFNNSLPLTNSHYLFTAPDNAPLCEVYNFSVTAVDVAATPVGAIYTGDGCNIIRSPVLSRMLPTKPRIEVLESSLSYIIEKHSADKVMFNVTFVPAKHCAKYPVTEYQLEVKEASSNQSLLLPSRNFNAYCNLSVNQLYTYRVIVSNNVSDVTTGYREIYTTDVQGATTTLARETNKVVLQCTFAIGSDAQGCMIVLMGEVGNVTKILKRSNADEQVDETLIIPRPLHCYTGLFAYDIESDGTIGTLGVPGEITIDVDTSEPCNTSTTVGLHPSTADSIPTWIIAAASVLVVAFLAIALVLILVMFILCRAKRSRTPRSDSFKNFIPASPAMSSAGPAPESPPPPPSDHLGDEEDINREKSQDPSPVYDLPEKFTSSCTQQDLEYNPGLDTQEHRYHVLEADTPRYLFNSRDFHKPATNGAVHDHCSSSDEARLSLSHSPPPHPPPPPIYQDISELSAVNRREEEDREERYDQVGDHNSGLSEPIDLDSNPPPVYQEITGLSSGRALSRPLDNMPSAGTDV